MRKRRETAPGAAALSGQFPPGSSAWGGGGRAARAEAETGRRTAERSPSPAQSSARRQSLRPPECGGEVLPRESSLREGLRASAAELSQAPPGGNQAQGWGAFPAALAALRAPLCHFAHLQSRPLAGASRSAHAAGEATARAWASGAEGVNRPWRGGARKGRKEIAAVLKVFFLPSFPCRRERPEAAPLILRSRAALLCSQSGRPTAWGEEQLSRSDLLCGPLSRGCAEPWTAQSWPGRSFPLG